MLFSYETDGLWGAMNEDSQKIIKPQFDFLSDFQDGFAYFRTQDQYGIIDLNGSIRYRISGITDLVLGEVGLVTFQNRDGKFGIFNVDGEILLEPKFTRLGRFRNGVCVANTATGVGAINLQGDWVIDPVFSTVASFEHTKEVTVATRNTKSSGNLSYIVNRTGNIVGDRSFLKLESPSDGVIPFLAELNTGERRWGLINFQGNVVLSPQFEAVDCVAQQNTFGAGKTDKSWGLYSAASGDELIRPNFDYLRSFWGHIGVYGEGDCYQDDELVLGFVNRQGDIVENARFWYIRQLSEDYFEVRQAAADAKHQIYSARRCITLPEP